MLKGTSYCREEICDGTTRWTYMPWDNTICLWRQQPRLSAPENYTLMSWPQELLFRLLHGTARLICRILKTEDGQLRSFLQMEKDFGTWLWFPTLSCTTDILATLSTNNLALSFIHSLVLVSPINLCMQQQGWLWKQQSHSSYQPCNALDPMPSLWLEFMVGRIIFLCQV